MTATGGEEVRTLACFHGLPAKATASVRDADVTADESGMTVRMGGNGYRIPHPGTGKERALL